MSARAPVAVLGGGFGGLVAAHELHRRGLDVIIYEAGPRVGGLATSHADPEGFRYDTGAHFVTNRLVAALGVGNTCRDVHRYGESVWLNGKPISYPLGLLTVPRFLRSAVAGRLSPSPGPPANAADWFQRAYGRSLAREIALPLVEAWSGRPAEQLSPDVGSKLPGGLLDTIRLKVASSVTGKAVAIGYGREQPAGTFVWHVYPEAGIEVLCGRIASQLASSTRLNAPVEAISIADGRVRSVRSKGIDQGVSAVVSTAPIHVLPRLIEGDASFEPFQKFRYRPMIFLNLKLNGRGLLPEVMTWTPGEDRPFFRLTEVPVAVPWLAPAGKTMITVDIGSDGNDEHWNRPDEEMAELCLAHLTDIVPDVRERYLGCRVVKTKLAYPVFDLEYEQTRHALDDICLGKGLVPIGRNGEFDHLLMEDVYWRTKWRMRDLAASLDGRRSAQPSGSVD